MAGHILNRFYNFFLSFTLELSLPNQFLNILLGNPQKHCDQRGRLTFSVFCLKFFIYLLFFLMTEEYMKNFENDFIFYDVVSLTYDFCTPSPRQPHHFGRCIINVLTIELTLTLRKHK